MKNHQNQPISKEFFEKTLDVMKADVKGISTDKAKTADKILEESPNNSPKPKSKDGKSY